MPAETNLKLRILVVDDDQIVCDCIRLMLTHDGHDVQAACSASAALALLEKEKFDLIFVDYTMPGTKGDELAVRIKAMAPNQPIIMVSGNAPPRKTLPGVDLVISKPIMLDDLRDAIAHSLRERSFAE